MPGWYPDPAGQPNRFRFWDGQSWSQQTSDNPQSPPPASGPSAGPPPGKRDRRGIWIGTAALALVIIVAAVFIVRGLLPDDPGSSGPLPSSTVSGWDDSSPIPSPSPSPTPSPSASRTPAPQQECPQGDPLFRNDHPSDGRIHGGGLSFAKVDGFHDATATAGLSWAYDVGAQQKTIEKSWISMFAVGTLRIADGFHEPKQAAEAVMQCTASSSFYRDFASRNDLSTREVTVGGHKGYAIRAEIFIDNPDYTTKGDVVEVIVLDVGSPEALGMYMGAVPIGDKDLMAQLDATAKDLRAS